MPRLRKIAYEKFAEHVASGAGLAESYRRTTGQIKNADVKGTQWHGYAGIKGRIAELKAQNAQRAQMTREELMAFYAAVIRTPADRVPAGSPVIQAYELTESGPKIRICDKAAAGAALARMCDWNSPEQLSIGVNTLTGYLRELRAQPLFGGPVLSIESRELPLKNGENGENGEESGRKGAEGVK